MKVDFKCNMNNQLWNLAIDSGSIRHDIKGRGFSPGGSPQISSVGGGAYIDKGVKPRGKHTYMSTYTGC